MAWPSRLLWRAMVDSWSIGRFVVDSSTTKRQSRRHVFHMEQPRVPHGTTLTHARQRILSPDIDKTLLSGFNPRIIRPRRVKILSRTQFAVKHGIYGSAESRISAA